MRLWSLHPDYLDAKGLVALWRETLLAQKVLLGKTKGYKNHPQLLRFKNQKDPILAIGNYLSKVAEAADKRGYQFNASKIIKSKKFSKPAMSVNAGQIKYEWQHLLKKLAKRDKVKLKEIKGIKKVTAHPLFKIVAGKVETWEKL